MDKYKKLVGLFCLGMAAATVVFINAGIRLGRTLKAIDRVLERAENPMDSSNRRIGYWKMMILCDGRKDFIIIYYIENPAIWKKSARQMPWRPNRYPYCNRICRINQEKYNMEEKHGKFNDSGCA